VLQGETQVRAVVVVVSSEIKMVRVIFVYLKFNGKLTKNQTKVIAPVLSFADPIISIR
jgi:hypothetical protein